MNGTQVAGGLVSVRWIKALALGCEILYTAHETQQDLYKVANLLSLGRPLAYRFLVVQLLVAITFAFAWFLSSPQAATAAGVGGLIAVLGNAFFVFAMFRHAGAQRAKRIATSLFVGEFGKLLIVITAFGFVFILTQLPPLPLFTGFIAVQSVFWIAPFIFKKSAQVKHA
jgi:ATP synthase protein I